MFPLGAGLEGDLLVGAGAGGVALDGGLGIGDLEGYVGGELAGEAPLFAHHKHHLNVLAFLHEVGIVDDVLGDGSARRSLRA